jgi:hypothetical protein
MNADRKETIELYAGLALPGVITANNPFFTSPEDIAKTAYDIAVAMYNLIEQKEADKLKTESDVS